MQNQLKIIEYFNINIPSQFKIKPNILPVYDFSSWKLIPENKQIISHSLASQEEKITHYKHEFGLVVTNEIDVKIALKYAKYLYIPGEFCRQSDLLEAAKNSKLPLIVEKGVFLSPNDIKRLCEKIQGANFCLVECGSSNGYSDSILDPRSLHLMKKSSPKFGVALSDLFFPQGIAYAHKPQWLHNVEFIEAFVKASLAFDASFFVVKNNAINVIDVEKIIKMMD